MAHVKENIQLALGKETAWGDSAARTVLVPFNSLSGSRNVASIIDNNIRGKPAKDYAAYRGGQSSKFSFDGWAYSDVVGHVLMAIMGQDAVTGAATPYTHTFSIAETPPSYAIEEDDIVENFVYPGCYCEELDLSFSVFDQPLTFKSSWQGKKDISGGTKTVVTDTASNPFLGRMATLELNGGANTRLIDFEANLKRPLTMVYTANNTDDAGQIVVGALEVTGKMTFDWSAVTELDLFRNATNGEIKVTWTFDANHTLILDVKTAYMEAGELDRGKDYITVGLQFRGLYDASLSGPCNFVLTNGQSAAY